MIYQRFATASPQAEKLVGLIMFGPPMVPGWSFGDVVVMANESMARPSLGNAAMARPGMADPGMETA